VTAAIHYSDDAVTLWHGDARQVSEFIPANTVDLLITSPPYFALRSYTDGGEHYDGQMGSEATPREFVDNLIAATADWVKVLKPTGSIWVNLGDKYAGSGGHNNAGLQPPSAKSTLKHDGRKNPRPIGDYERGAYTGPAATRRQAPDRYNQASDGIPAKSLMGLPWRYANRVVDELGLILRECIIWQKPNGLPESVTDRCRVSHEYLFHFTRQGRYFAAMDEIREASDPKNVAYFSTDGLQATSYADRLTDTNNRSGRAIACNPLGKLPGSVWSMPSEPLVVPDHLGVDHFAAFPSELPRRIILGWSPTAYCTTCDEPRRAVVAKELEVRQNLTRSRPGQQDTGKHGTPGRNELGIEQLVGTSSATITGYACACPTNDAPTRPAVVLDPFIGTGTTAAVAKALGRNAIGVDLSRDYLRLAEWRVNDPGIARKVLERSGVRVPKAPVIDGQLDLLDGAA
jgi:DNA modification methylase